MSVLSFDLQIKISIRNPHKINFNFKLSLEWNWSFSAFNKNLNAKTFEEFSFSYFGMTVFERKLNWRNSLAGSIWDFPSTQMHNLNVKPSWWTGKLNCCENFTLLNVFLRRRWKFSRTFNLLKQIFNRFFFWFFRETNFW